MGMSVKNVKNLKKKNFSTSNMCRVDCVRCFESVGQQKAVNVDATKLTFGIVRSQNGSVVLISRDNKVTMRQRLFTHAYGSRVSIAVMRLCLSVCLSVCSHDTN